MKSVLDEKDNSVLCSVFSELKSLGVKVPKVKKFKSGISKQTKAVPYTKRIFGVNLSEQEKTSVADCVIPKFIFTTTTYLKKYSKIEIGLFRKTGSVSRQRDLRVKLERGESIEESEPNDVASLLKKWLRELPEPLIPVYMQDLFIRCQNLQIEENRVAAILLCCHLLPVEHLHTLKYLLQFLFDIASNSDKNKMGAYNLALVMAPNIFVMGTESIDKSSNLLQLHTSVLEVLINYVQRISVTPQCSSLHLAEFEALKYGTDLDLSVDDLDYSPSKSKKKRKSGPVQDLFTGFRKLVGQNTTPPNPSKRLNQDDGKSAPISASRSASKRKAGPEQLSLSPLKKQATASSNVLQNGNLNFTPNTKSSWNTLGAMKEKSSSAHTRRKSFGLLRRKDKKSRQKSSKSNELVGNKFEQKVIITTPSPFEEKLAESLQEPETIQQSYVDKSSPLLSTSDIDKILSRPKFTKKSISDCYLIAQDQGYLNRPVFSTSSSEGCLYQIKSKNSPYNLRSNSLSVTSLKCKSDVLNIVSEAGKEDTKQSYSPRLIKKISPLSKHASPKQKTLSSENVTPGTKSSFSENNSSTMIKDFDQTDSLNTSQLLNRRISSRKKINYDLKDSHASLVSKTEKLESDNYPDSSDIQDVKDNVSNHTLTTAKMHSSKGLYVENEDKIKRQCSLKRQEAFMIRSENSKKISSLSQIRRDNSIKIANSKSKNSYTNPDDENSNSDMNSVKKKIQNAVLTNTPEKRRIKRNARNGSIVRGRPNTVKTGLPCNRYNNDSIFIDTKHNVLTSTTSVDNNLFISVINESKKNHDMSVTVQIPDITLNTPGEENASKNINAKTDIQNSSFQAAVFLDVKETKIVSKRKMRDRICSNSDSKIHKMKTRSSTVERINSFPGSVSKRSKIKKLSAVNITPKKSIDVESKIVPNNVDKENIFVQESPANISTDNVFKTPNVNFQTPETWFSGREYLEAEKPREEDVGNKRESIAMILKNKPGHVQQKVCMYDNRSRTSLNNTPLMVQSATRNGSFYDPQFSNRQSGLSPKRSSSVRSNRSMKTRYSHLPPPPKFVIPDSPPKLSYPLKELTNISNAEDIICSPSPAKSSFSTMNDDKNSTEKANRCTLKPKRNSYSGHTPYKLPKDKNKVLRSESSPLLQKAASKSSQKLQEFLTQSPSSKICDSNLSSSSNKTCFSSPVFKTKSSLSIEKLRLDQLTDEWHCEM